MPAVALTSTCMRPSHSPQQEVVIPDSEESPGRCSQQRQEPHAASPLLNECPTGTSDKGRHDITDVSLVTLQQSSAQHRVGRHSSSSHDRSGCSMEALPEHSQPEVCTQSAPAEQHTGRALGCVVHRQAASQQQRCPPQSMSFAAAFLPHDAEEDAAPTVAAAPAPAGPIEHLQDSNRGPDAGEEAPNGSGNQQRGGQGPVGAQAGGVAGIDQQTHRAYPLDGSQPSSSSLKRVPETPDSVENRSQPTQSPNGQSTHTALDSMSWQWQLKQQFITHLQIPNIYLGKLSVSA